MTHAHRRTPDGLVLDKGYGFIRREPSPSYFFHRTALEGAPFEDLQIGQSARFEPDKRSLTRALRRLAAPLVWDTAFSKTRGYTESRGRSPTRAGVVAISGPLPAARR